MLTHKLVTVLVTSSQRVNYHTVHVLFTRALASHAFAATAHGMHSPGEQLPGLQRSTPDQTRPPAPGSMRCRRQPCVRAARTTLPRPAPSGRAAPRRVVSRPPRRAAGRAESDRAER